MHVVLGRRLAKYVVEEHVGTVSHRHGGVVVKAGLDDVSHAKVVLDNVVGLVELQLFFYHAQVFFINNILGHLVIIEQLVD